MTQGDLLPCSKTVLSIYDKDHCWLSNMRARQYSGIFCNFKVLRLCFDNGFDDLNIKISQSRHLPMLGRPK